MRFCVWVSLALAAVVAPLGQSQVRAWFQFTNKTSKPVYVAFVRSMPGCEGGVPWEKRGWWRLEPGQTKTVQGESITNRYSYYYAESDDRTWVWTSAGPAACLPQPAFTWCWNTCNNSPTTRWLNVRMADTGSYSDYTINLTLPGRSPGSAPGRSEDATESRDRAAARSEARLPASGGPAHADAGSSDESGVDNAAGAPSTGAAVPREPGAAADADPMGGADSLPTADPMSGGDTPSVNPARPRQAMPASPEPVIAKQPDGTRIALHIMGDEKVNWQADLNGYPVTRKANGYYVYATVDSEGRLKATDAIVGKEDPALAGIKKTRPTTSTGAEEPPLADPMGGAPAPKSAQSKTTERLPPSAPDTPQPTGGTPDPMSNGPQ